MIQVAVPEQSTVGNSASYISPKNNNNQSRNTQSGIPKSNNGADTKVNWEGKGGRRCNRSKKEIRSSGDTSKLLDWIPLVEEKVNRQAQASKAEHNNHLTQARKYELEWKNSIEFAIRRISILGKSATSEDVSIFLPLFSKNTGKVIPGFGNFFYKWWSEAPLRTVITRCHNLSKNLMDLELRRIDVTSYDEVPDDTRSTRKLLSVKDIITIVNNSCGLIRPETHLHNSEDEVNENEDNLEYGEQKISVKEGPSMTTQYHFLYEPKQNAILE